MALADVAKTRIVKGPPCTVCLAIKALPDTESAALVAMMRNRGWRYSEISDALRTEHGMDLPAFSIGRHARGECSARTKLRGA